MTVSKATQLFSRHVAMGFKHYREKKETATDFKYTAPTERMTLLLNDCFDIINGRFPQEGINRSSWEKKKLKISLESCGQSMTILPRTLGSIFFAFFLSTTRKRLPPEMKTSTDAGEILVAYKQCLVYKFRECEKEAKEIKKNLKDSLQKEFLVRYSNEIPDGKSDTTRDQLVYDFCGYIIHTQNEFYLRRIMLRNSSSESIMNRV
ncbi:hypothetical protein OUZ56_009803 [Daphnia magna]|uniref:Transposable element P transposase-like GTP-binding insertion domain-containing protein n=1 Tax=Daphnia magna TaxID=35525 RepID=A0ABR0AGZ1_9CRUS|nr:hypothetical protein OUZ56_009803 [Daphnia magna]